MVLVPFRLSEPTCPSLVRLNITQTVAVLRVDLGSSSIQCSSIIWPLSVSDYGSKLWPELKNGCQKESVGLPQAAACMRAKSLWSFLTLCNPKDCRPLGSSVHGDSPGKNTAVGCHFLFQGIFPSQGSNPGLLHCRQILYFLSYPGKPIFGGGGCYSASCSGTEQIQRPQSLREFLQESNHGIPLVRTSLCTHSLPPFSSSVEFITVSS